MTHDLNHAPPRLSDLRGDELAQALAERHQRHKANWLSTRVRPRLGERVREWFRRERVA